MGGPPGPAGYDLHASQPPFPRQSIPSSALQSATHIIPQYSIRSVSLRCIHSHTVLHNVPNANNFSTKQTHTIYCTVYFCESAVNNVWFASNCMCLLIIFLDSGGCTLIWMMLGTVNKLTVQSNYSEIGYTSFKGCPYAEFFSTGRTYADLF